MAYDGWIEFGGVEVVNVSRTVQLANALGIDTVWIEADEVEWVQTALAGADYEDITTAPWYDSGYTPSMEFAGIIPLSITGLDDSSLAASPVEYVTDGGHSGKARNSTLPMVANVVLIGSTDRGVEYGKRWLSNVLRGASTKFCNGDTLRYFQWDGADAPKMHRNDVSTTRGVSVTRKRVTDCSATWMLTFTWTAGDPFEYSEPMFQFENFYEAPFTGPGVDDYDGPITMIQATCPVYDYSPIYDPLFPALVPPPTPPDFYPDGWDIAPGMTFDRWWVTTHPVEPNRLDIVPVLTLSTTIEARMVRIQFWDHQEQEAQCDPLFTAIVTYLPAGLDLVIDGEQRACYVWDGVSSSVRRADSLVYGEDASPIDWKAFNAAGHLMMTMDLFSESGDVEGGGEVRAALSYVSKSD